MLNQTKNQRISKVPAPDQVRILRIMARGGSILKTVYRPGTETIKLVPGPGTGSDHGVEAWNGSGNGVDLTAAMLQSLIGPGWVASGPIGVVSPGIVRRSYHLTPAGVEALNPFKANNKI